MCTVQAQPTSSPARLVAMGAITTLALALFAAQPSRAAEGQSLKLNEPERSVLIDQMLRFPDFRPFAARATTKVTPLFGVEPRKSIFVTDVASTTQLKFEEVMAKLARDGGDPQQTALTVFQQWWDSQAMAPGTKTGPHCDDRQIVGRGLPAPTCPRPEAAEAASDPFKDETNGYTAIAYSNRFDLIDPANPVDCGEYRVVFARNPGKGRNLVIFEARVPNPRPSEGIRGCTDIQEFWFGLSSPSVTVDQRGALLRKFYLEGLPGKNVGPVISAANYAPGTGQIRSNQFMAASAGNTWTLREFKIVDIRPGIRIVPVTVKVNPDPSLFAAGPVDLQARLASRISDEFQNLRGGNGIAGETTQAISLHLSRPPDDDFNSFESEEGKDIAGSIVAAFLASAKTSMVGAFLAAKIAELTPAGTRLTPLDVVRRIETQSCSGCHQWSNNSDLGPTGANNKWPASLGFTHVSEGKEVVAGVERFLVSPALQSPGFIPARCRLVASFLNMSDGQCDMP